MTTPKVRHSRIPLDVLHSSLVSAQAKVVYCEMASWVFEGTTCARGQRQIAGKTKLARSTVMVAIQELIAAKYIEVVSSAKPGKRQIYILKSPLYGQKQGHETVVASSPSRGMRFASIGPDIAIKTA